MVKLTKPRDLHRSRHDDGKNSFLGYGLSQNTAASTWTCSSHPANIFICINTMENQKNKKTVFVNAFNIEHRRSWEKFLWDLRCSMLKAMKKSNLIASDCYVN